MVMGREDFISSAMATHFNDHSSFPLSRYFEKYHVVVHESAFDRFLYILDENIIPYWYREHGDHVHFLVHSKYPFETRNGIISRHLESKSRFNYVKRTYFNGWVERLHFYCSFTFENLSLQEIAMDKILSNLRCLHDLKQLNIPVLLIKRLFRRAKSHFYLPEWDGKTVSRNTDISDIDRVYDGEFVVRYQYTENIYYSAWVVIENHFEKPDGEIVKLCRKCMHFEMEKGIYCRRYKYKHSPRELTSSNFYVIDPWNWCHACKRVPLFQMLTFDEGYRQYNIGTWNPGYEILKTEYFKDGIQIPKDAIDVEIKADARPEFFLEKYIALFVFDC